MLLGCAVLHWNGLRPVDVDLLARRPHLPGSSLPTSPLLDLLLPSRFREGSSG